MDILDLTKNYNASKNQMNMVLLSAIFLLNYILIISRILKILQLIA
jgi:hypothetical protein